VIRLPILPAAAAVPEVHHNCARCPALCCSYVSTEIDPPTTGRDFDHIRWYLMHPGVRVYCEDATGSWFIQFMSRCQNLGEDHRCTIYETRPQICRDLDANLCEFGLGPGDRWLFTTLDEFDRWMQEREHRRRRRAARPKTARPRAARARKARAAP
jgi:hypothetical protein